MRLAVVTAFLLLVGVLNIVTASDGYQNTCDMFKEEDCGDGWTNAKDNFCAKYFLTLKSFQDAQEDCQSQGAQLLTVDRPEFLLPMFCFTVFKTPESEHQNVWVERKKTVTEEEKFEEPYLDSDQAGDECVEMDAKVFGEFNDVPCSKKNFFVCLKKTD